MKETHHRAPNRTSGPAEANCAISLKKLKRFKKRKKTVVLNFYNFLQYGGHKQFT